MRLTATNVGFFEDYEDEEVLEVAIAGVDDAGSRRSISIQRSTYEPDEQEVQSGMDSYNISTERGFTVYGCLHSVRLTDSLLTLEFTAEDAEILEIPTPVEIDLRESGTTNADLRNKLRAILDWGSHEKRPQMIGMSISDPPPGE
ncbi:Imm10 family immunity protein [Streptomyces sp. NBRC 110028]|uniref:Imm10 family immunity protein n=1 Tax=Streptomyces sp. NBRC 110028 TaxID=1621260 RepID=UPI00099F1728|nr:Imm10 family immunity protein [Streptomyces sp. NBRC 110028]